MTRLGFLLGFTGLLAASTTLVACGPVRVINALTPTRDLLVHKDMAYGSLPRQQLDIYQPAASRHNAVVVFVHGGSWASGSKDDYLFVGQAFASMGFTTVIPNYRLYPDAVFPDFINDVAQAVARLPALLNMQEEPCADPLRLILVGHSAGAHTVAMLVTDPQYLQRAGAKAQVLGWVGMAGPYDLPLDDPLVVDKFRAVQGDEANPLRLATAAVPPALLLHGTADDTVYPYHSERLAARLQQLAVPVTLREYAGTNHTRLLGSLASTLRFLNPAYEDIEQFVDQLDPPGRCPVRATAS